MGDFNAKTALAYRKCNFDGTQLAQDDECNDNGYRLKNFCRDFKLGIAATYFDYPAENRITWYSCDKKTKRINDYVLTERFVQQYVTNCIVKPEYDFDSDHRLLITELRTPTTRNARWRERPIPKPPRLNIAALQDATLQIQYANETEKQLNRPLTNESTEECSTRIVNTLNTAARTVIPPAARSNEENEIWRRDYEFNNIIVERQAVDKTTDAYKELTKRLKKRIRFLRNERLRQEANAINSLATKREVEELYRRMKSDSSTFKSARSSNKCHPSRLKEHFTQHFDRDIEKEVPRELLLAPEFIKTLQDIPGNANVDPPNKTELQDIIKKLKNGRSANDIPAAFVKSAAHSDEFVTEITNLYKEIWKTHEIPKSWSHSRLVAIWKGSSKGKLDDPTAYRGLQIGSSLCKILIIIIINRMKSWYENQLGDQQQGFRSGRGTTDGIFITKRIQQISHKMKKPLYALFVDLTAAFDKIERHWLFSSIRQRMPGSQKLVDLLQKLYSHTTTALAETPDDIFELILGVRQGGPESPMLYNLYMDYVMRIFKITCTSKNIEFPKLFYKIPVSATTKERSLVGFNMIDWIGYADDLLLVFNDKNHLQDALTLMN